MATKKRSNSSSKKQTKAQNKASRQLHSVIWFAVAVFLMFVVFVKGQNVWTVMHNFMFRIFGFTAYFYPFLLGAVAIIFATDKFSSSINAKIIESIVLVVLVGAAIDIFSTHSADVTFWQHLKTAFEFGAGKASGGFLGALIGYPLYLAFGKTGAAITVILLIFVFLMIITGTTLIALFKTVSKPVKVVSEQA